MWFRKRKADRARDGFLVRLARDKRGNTLMLFVFSLIPLVGVVGGGLDLSRLYLVKTRLQHGCDAGALAGRKKMGAGNWTTGSGSSQEVAQKFFDANFPADAYGATGVTRSFTEADGNVNGSASADVPMTLMKVLDIQSKTLAVSCSARQQVPNTDIMFVLDNTESMSQDDNGNNHNPAGDDPGPTSRIVNLKANVKCFFEAISKLDTGESTCDAITGTATTSRLRFGLVPYATNVNIKQLDLPSSYFASRWKYQSRRWHKGKWEYKQVTHVFSGFNNSSTTITLPLGDNGDDTDLTWTGCLEEEAPITDINVVPSTSDTNSLFAPSLPGAVYYRNQAAGPKTVNASNLTDNPVDTPDNLFRATTYPYFSCPDAPAYRLQEYTGTTGVTNFVTRVNAMKHAGNTRHDIGMLWGGRLLSPRGMIGLTDTPPSNGGRVYRHLIFMTDGDAKANECDYATYGIPWFDKREVPEGTTISKSNCGNLGNPNTTLTDAVYTRLNALCTAVKAEADTRLWVISYGGKGIDPTTKTKLENCATNKLHFFDATSDDELKKAFKQIAAQVTQLRLTS